MYANNRQSKVTVPVELMNQSPRLDRSTNDNDVTEVFPPPAQETQPLSHKQMTKIKQRRAKNPETNHDDSGKHYFTEKKDHAEKNQHRKTGAFKKFDGFAPVGGDPARAINVQKLKDYPINHQDQNPGDNVMAENTSLRQKRKIYIKAQKIRQPP
jgi:hypothetical protein